MNVINEFTKRAMAAGLTEEQANAFVAQTFSQEKVAEDQLDTLYSNICNAAGVEKTANASVYLDGFLKHAMARGFSPEESIELAKVGVASVYAGDIQKQASGEELAQDAYWSGVWEKMANGYDADTRLADFNNGDQGFLPPGYNSAPEMNARMRNKTEQGAPHPAGNKLSALEQLKAYLAQAQAWAASKMPTSTAGRVGLGAAALGIPAAGYGMYRYLHEDEDHPRRKHAGEILDDSSGSGIRYTKGYYEPMLADSQARIAELNRAQNAAQKQISDLMNAQNAAQKQISGLNNKLTDATGRGEALQYEHDLSYAKPGEATLKYLKEYLAQNPTLALGAGAGALGAGIGALSGMSSDKEDRHVGRNALIGGLAGPGIGALVGNYQPELVHKGLSTFTGPEGFKV